jgi:selenide,water dikinase
MVQSLDFLTPVVNDPHGFGRIAAANSLSDIYAVGGEPYTALNIVCFPSKVQPLSVLKEILRGGMETIREAGAIMCGGHSVEDREMKYGLSVTGTVDPNAYATNGGLRDGDRLILTKPLGTGVLATAIKAEWPNAEQLEQELVSWAGRLNKEGARAIRELELQGATDITGFGLGGHSLEMARASGLTIELWSERVPILDSARELAGMGILPEGSYANKHFCSSLVHLGNGVEELTVDLIFDAQTSGGLLLAVPEKRVREAREFLESLGETVAEVGRVLSSSEAGLHII